jgi:cell division inhibitor SulA
MNKVVQLIHDWFRHITLNKMKILLTQGIKNIITLRIEILPMTGRKRSCCAGCLEGKIKELAKIHSTKP